MPSREGSAASAAALVSSTLCPFAPAGARSLAASTSVNTPSKSTLFGWPFTGGILTAIASTRIHSPQKKKPFAETYQDRGFPILDAYFAARVGCSNGQPATIRTFAYVETRGWSRP